MTERDKRTYILDLFKQHYDNASDLFRTEYELEQAQLKVGQLTTIKKNLESSQQDISDRFYYTTGLEIDECIPNDFE